MKLYQASVSFEEKRQHSTILVPYSFYECRLPEEIRNVPMHWHTEFELNYIRKGNGIFFCGDERFEAKVGDVLLIQPNTMHASYMTEDDGQLWYDALVFSAVMIGENGNDRCTNDIIRPITNGTISVNTKYDSGCKGYSEMRKSAEQIFSFANKSSPVNDMLIKSELLRLFWLIQKNGYTSTNDSASSSHSEMLRPALMYIADNYRKHIMVDDLAGQVHMSPSYFMRCFKRTVGVSAIEYLGQVRINASCRLLTETERSVSDISFACGYENLSNFNKQFKDAVGCTPLEYRTTYRLPQ